MATLNKKNGALRGVKAFIQSEPGANFDEISAQGWVIWEDKKYGFNIDVFDKDTKRLTTLEFTESAIYRILDAIAEKSGEAEIKSIYGKAKERLVTTFCNLDGCGCIPIPIELEAIPNFNLQR